MKEHDILKGRGVNPASILGRRLLRGQKVKVEEEVKIDPPKPRKVKKVINVKSSQPQKKTHKTR